MPLHGEARDRPTYQNLRPIGQGQSEAYAGDHGIFDHPVVQKVVADPALDPDALLLHEPQLLKSLEHPRIPRITEAQYDPASPGSIIMVMENVGELSGGATVLGQVPPLSVGECVAVALDLLSALSYLHVVRGVVHRDIRHDNFRLSSDRRRAWLIDFDLAGRLGPDGRVAGALTPMAWMAPEVHTAGYSVQAELYALAVVLYEQLRGRQMLVDYDEERIEARVTSGHRAFPDEHYRRWPPHVPDGLRRILNKGVVAAPAQRWGSAHDMEAALGRLVYVDWRQDPNDDERWVGTWPSNASLTDRTDVEVTVQTLRGGPDRGARRACARYMPGTGWSRLRGLTDRLVGTQGELSQFFEDADKRLAALRPAR